VIGEGFSKRDFSMRSKIATQDTVAQTLDRALQISSYNHEGDEEIG
jgi:hypothetical protein